MGRRERLQLPRLDDQPPRWNPLVFACTRAFATFANLPIAAFALFDVRTLRAIWKIDRIEFSLAVTTMLGVVAVGPIKGILFGVGPRAVHQANRAIPG
jgi:hypothetical protein